MKSKKQKPTSKDIIGEVNYLGNRVVQLEGVVRNLVTVVDKYIKFKGDDDKYKSYLEEEAKKRNSIKDMLDSESSSKSENPKTAKIS